MKVSQENSEEVIRYLYNEIADTERDALEERLFTNDDFSLFAESAENDLVDEYVRGEMSFAEKQRFEKNYLISENRREKVRAANILQTKLFNEKQAKMPVNISPQVSVWQSLAEFFRVPSFAFAGGLALILLTVLVGGWFLLRQTPNQPEIVRDENTNRQTPIPSPQNLPKNDISENTNKPETNVNKPANIENKATEKKNLPTNEKPDKPTEIAPQPRVFAATLLPMLRSGERSALNIPKNAETVSLRVVHDNQKTFAKYRAEIRDQNGKVIVTREFPVNEKTLSRPLNLSVKNSALSAGSYELTLRGISNENQTEEIKFYNFTVNKK